MAATNYIWDPLSDNVVMEVDDGGDVLAEYTQEPGLYGSVVSQNRSGVESHYHYDGQGSVRQLTNIAGVVTDEGTYTAFGEVVSKAGDTINPWRYKGNLGYFTNEESDDLYARARDLLIVFGRWSSPDPVGLSNGANLYTYCKNSPLDRADPSGLSSVRFDRNQADEFIQELGPAYSVCCRVRWRCEARQGADTFWPSASASSTFGELDIVAKNAIDNNLLISACRDAYPESGIEGFKIWDSARRQFADLGPPSEARYRCCYPVKTTALRGKCRWFYGFVFQDCAARYSNTDGKFRPDFTLGKQKDSSRALADVLNWAAGIEPTPADCQVRCKDIISCVPAIQFGEQVSTWWSNMVDAHCKAFCATMRDTSG